MSTQPYPSNNFSGTLSNWLNRRLMWLAKHWLAVANAFFFTYVGLPILAPMLLAAGFTGAANAIYQVYNMLCHQLPTRTYFVFGEQVAMCQRCISIYVALFAGGVVFNFARYRQLPIQWYILFALPMAIDGGTAFVSEVSQVLPLWPFWLIAGSVMAILWFWLRRQGLMFWQMYVVFAGILLGLAYVQIFGPRISNVYLRNLTGLIFGVGTVWFAYPSLDEGFKDTWREASAYLNRPE
jgi:uncharacterized membrane protein